MRKSYGGCLHFEFGRYGNGGYYDAYDKVDVDSGRSAIQYIIENENYDEIWLPVYNCPLVSLKIKQIFPDLKIKFYNLDDDFTPILPKDINNALVLYVNYFGIISDNILNNVAELSKKHRIEVIIDNIQAYFEFPRENVYNIYSCRKFIGVPDGGHIIKKGINTKQLPDYNTAENYGYLLKAVEVDSGYVYEDYKKSEKRFQENASVYGMSELTNKILSNVDYDFIKRKRKNNFNLIDKKLSKYNLLDLSNISDNKIPLVYPLITKQGGTEIRRLLVESNIFVSTFWKHIITNPFANDFEYNMAENLIPLPIDQRYDDEDILDMISIVLKIIREVKI